MCYLCVCFVSSKRKKKEEQISRKKRKKRKKKERKKKETLQVGPFAFFSFFFKAATVKSSGTQTGTVVPKVLLSLPVPVPCLTTPSSLMGFFQRFSLTAAELNGALYAVGGYDGKNYLNTAERFDPREHSWTKIESMNTVRGCPSLVVLNEKLYVLGGFDGRAMVPSVEIYDPRRGSWVIGDSMSYPRGFSAAAVVKESIYILGGLKRGDDINDTVECYKEGQGWEIFDTKAGSRRCFFSAVAR